MSNKKRARERLLLVPYDEGSLPPVRIAEIAALNECDLTFLVSESKHAVSMLPVLRSLGATITLGDEPDSAILRLLERQNADGIVTFSEHLLERTAWFATHLGLPGHELDIIQSVIRKDRQRESLAAHGVDVIRYRTVASLEHLDLAIDQVGLPAIVKPAVGVGSALTTVVFDAAAAESAVRSILNRPDRAELGHRIAILEEYLVGRYTDWPWGDYIAVDCLADNHAAKPLFVTSKFALAEPFRERGGYGGMGAASEEDAEAACELACAVVDALRAVTGVVDVEMKLTDTGPRLIEANGRLGGWVDDLAVRSGMGSPADAAVRAALSLAPVRVPPTVDSPLAYSYVVMPPRWARRVVDIQKPDPVRRLPNVERVTVSAWPGMPLDWQQGAVTALATVQGLAGTHDELSSLVQEFEAFPWAVFQ